jgi:16S rRNA G966 N2-methylase RsmD
MADIVFLDPPYELVDEYDRTLRFLGGSPVLASSGLVIAEHARRHPLGEHFSQLARVRLVEQGDAALSFYRHTPQNRP